ncbi:LuxR C-terminal-related transcriptional regulator [Leifsonia sp. NPDC058230]|uniref:helix-turn-helix transcriptional regulator n=1 Tax=Leifsonia sp. NPDC058230 TaxID=3346391 RepID=UPI0036DCE45A
MRRVMVAAQPPLPLHLIRNRTLEDRLQYLAESRPVIWISAPPRSGKRTAVNSWLQNRNASVRWHHRRGEPVLDSVLGEISALAGQDEPLVLVVESSAPVSGSDVLELDDVVSRHPQLRVVVVDDQADGAASNDDGRLPELTTSDVALTVPAIEAAAVGLGVHVPGPIMGALTGRFAGNPPLVASVMTDRLETPLHTARESLNLAHAGELVVLARELLHDRADDLLALLALVGAVPERVIVELAGSEEIAHVLRAMWRRGLLEIEDEAGTHDAQYRLPRAVSELIRALTLPRYLEKRTQLHRIAARVFILKDELARAVGHLALAGDSGAAVELFCEHWDRPVGRGAWDEALTAFDTLDAVEVMKDIVAVSAGCIVGSVSGSPTMAQFEARIRTVKESELESLNLRQQTTVRIAQALLLMRAGRTRAAQSLVTDALATYERRAVAERLELRGVYLELVLAAARTALLRGALRQCVTLYTEAVVLAEHEDAPAGLYRALCGKALALSLSAEFDTSQALIDRAKQLRADHAEVAHLSSAELMWSQGIIWLHSGSARELRAAIDDIAVRDSPEDSLTWVGSLLEARTLLARGNSVEAASALRSWLASVRSAPRDVPLLREAAIVSLGMALVMSNQAGAALQVVEAESTNESHTPCLARVRPYALILQGLPRDALDATDECVALGHEHSLLSLTYVYIARALAYEALDLPSSAEDALLSALGLTVSAGTHIDMRTCLGDNLWDVLARARLKSPDLVRRAERLFDGSPAQEGSSSPRLARLTQRERDVLERLAGPDTISVIAAAMFLSDNTVKTHVKNLYAKLGVVSRQEAVDLAVSWGTHVGDRRSGG